MSINKSRNVETTVLPLMELAPWQFVAEVFTPVGDAEATHVYIVRYGAGGQQNSFYSCILNHATRDVFVAKIDKYRDIPHELPAAVTSILHQVWPQSRVTFT